MQTVIQTLHCRSYLPTGSKNLIKVKKMILEQQSSHTY